VADSRSRKAPPAPSAAPSDRGAPPPLKGARSRRPPRDRPEAEGGSEPLEWIKSLAGAVLLFLLIRTFLITAYSIPSESMENSLLVGDYLMANNALFGATIPLTEVRLPALRDPRRGEIVVFRPDYNHPRMDVVKRVIGIPGDTVEMRERALFLNGRPVEEPYARYSEGFAQGITAMDPTVRPGATGVHNHLPLLLADVDREQYRPTSHTWGPLVLPPGQYWLMGDNRDQSLDSRFVGPVPREVIRGKPLFIYFSYDRRADAPFPRALTAARWGRIGSRVR
jgi:signal peptidase I